jgi:hypothetical protein
MQKYLGVKLIEAEPKNKYEFYMNVKGVDCKEENEDGYLVKYEDNYISWSPKDVFEKAYYPIASNNNTISQKDVDLFIKDVKSIKQGEKTTVTTVTLINGFEIIESSSCVDAKNFNMAIGEKICVERVKNLIWEMLGFVLCSGVHGLNQ